MAVCAVTGSASGIGRATRKRLEELGNSVIGVDLQDAEISADLGTPEGRTTAIQAIEARCPNGLDRLVLAAGLGGYFEDLRPIASVNYFGVVDVLDGLLDGLRRGTDPAVVALCSNSAQMEDFDGAPYVEALLAHDEEKARSLVAGPDADAMLAYGGGKNALGKAIRRRAMKWGEAGVRLNAIAPGPTLTPLLQGSLDHPEQGPLVRGLNLPLGRFAQPEEMAAVICFMLSPEASYVHGAIWYADAGNDADMRPDRY